MSTRPDLAITTLTDPDTTNDADAELSYDQLFDHIQQVEMGATLIDVTFYHALQVRQDTDPDGKFLRLTPTIRRAIETAARLHQSQFRKGSASNQIPYISHLLGVTEILARYTVEETILVAGLLHDSTEDEEYTHYTPEQLAIDFGEEVAVVVAGVTEDISLKQLNGEKGSWQERKNKYLDRLREASPASQLVACADKIHNLRSLIAAYLEEGDIVWERFNAPNPKVDMMWYFDQVLDIVKTSSINPSIIVELENTILEAYKLFEKGKET